MPSVAVVDDDYEVNVAVRILNGPNIDEALMHQLVGQPRRYGDLRSRLKLKADMELNRSLRRLLDEGVIDQVSDYSKKPAIKTYRLTPLGVEVFYAMAAIRNPVISYAQIARALRQAGAGPF